MIKSDCQPEAELFSGVRQRTQPRQGQLLMMTYANQPIDYGFDSGSSSEEASSDRRKDYSRGRSYKSLRRRARRRSSSPGCGIAARRNRRHG